MRVEQSRVNESVAEAKHTILEICPHAAIDENFLTIDQTLRAIIEDETGHHEPIISDAMKNDLAIEEAATNYFHR